MTHPLLNEWLARQHGDELHCDAERRRRALLPGRLRSRHSARQRAGRAVL